MLNNVPDLSKSPHVPDDFDPADPESKYMGLAGIAMIASVVNARQLLPVPYEDLDRMIHQFLGETADQGNEDERVLNVLFDAVQEIFIARYPWALEFEDLIGNRDDDPVDKEPASWEKWKHFTLLEIEALGKFHAKHGEYVAVEVISEDELRSVIARVEEATAQREAANEALVNMLRNMGLDTDSIFKAQQGE